MPASLRAASGSYGFGVRPLRPSLIAGRNVSYSSRNVVHPSTPNGSFSITINGLQLIVRGSDGNQSGFANASDLIDGTGQALIDNFAVFSEADNAFYAMVYNAANEFRLVKALFNGSITTPGVKFSAVTPANLKGRSFCYESGNNIVMRVSNASSIYQHVIAKATGQIVSQNTLITSAAALANGYYTTADGTITFGYFDTPSIGGGADEGWIMLHGLSINGTLIPPTKISTLEVFGLFIRTAGQTYAAQSGKYLCFIPVIASGAEIPLQLVERSEFDRWLRDVVNKFKYV